MDKRVLIILAAVIVAGAIVFGVVAKNDENSQTNTPANTNTEGQNQNQNSQSSSNVQNTETTSAKTVIIQNFAFTPNKVTVKKGTTVTWTNNDSSPHTVTETDGKTGPKSTQLSQGQTYNFTYNETGQFVYHCELHTTMTGTVEVTD